ncbi:hypothetical protein L1987_37850 [Smallanthus sonchifolius]|uniref:Uncharacterized protein n=1 Tax=Smallanthus sonchifolius TaxID=185202 RepID=A0ACB9HI80_9ASTR|nr:hypothetical protein L1987_37850 [Smallanthus sonchifolius]
MDERKEAGGGERMNDTADDGGTTPMHGIGLKVTNIDGIPFLPRRGMYSTNNVSVLDGLFEISKPVGNEYNKEGMDGLLAENPTNFTHANPIMENSYMVDEHLDDIAPQDDPSNHRDREVGNPLTFAKVVQQEKKSVKVNFRHMESSEKVDGVDVVIPLSSVKEEIPNVERLEKQQMVNPIGEKGGTEEVVVDDVDVDDMLHDYVEGYDSKKKNNSSEGASTPGRTGFNG